MNEAEWTANLNSQFAICWPKNISNSFMELYIQKSERNES